MTCYTFGAEPPPGETELVGAKRLIQGYLVYKKPPPPRNLSRPMPGALW